VFWEGRAPLVTQIVLSTMSWMNYYLWTQKDIDKYAENIRSR